MKIKRLVNWKYHLANQCTILSVCYSTIHSVNQLFNLSFNYLSVLSFHQPFIQFINRSIHWLYNIHWIGNLPHSTSHLFRQSFLFNQTIIQSINRPLNWSSVALNESFIFRSSCFRCWCRCSSLSCWNQKWSPRWSESKATILHPQTAPYTITRCLRSWGSDLNIQRHLNPSSLLTSTWRLLSSALLSVIEEPGEKPNVAKQW